mmetsp:Transcript_2142/g.6769  ORF Transcript_2142/g.6769 Transcript_2142/m.6769 type:complete len:518 (-) Transcript_2142:79-1632(-)
MSAFPDSRHNNYLLSPDTSRCKPLLPEQRWSISVTCPNFRHELIMQDLCELQSQERTLASELLQLPPAVRRTRADLQEREREIETQLEERRRDLLKLFKRLVEKKTVHSHVHRHCPHLVPRERRLELCRELPNYPVRSVVHPDERVILAGPPPDESPVSLGAQVTGHTVSTYPRVGEERYGDPVADFFSAHLFREAAVLALADGCNWGEGPRRAAARAAEGFSSYVYERLDEIEKVSDLGPVLLRGLAVAHHNVSVDSTEVFHVGTTTLLGAVLLPLGDGCESVSVTEQRPAQGTLAAAAEQVAAEREAELDAGGSPQARSRSGVQGLPRWAIGLVSVGDAKAFLWQRATGKVVDFTCDNRTYSLSAKDCGGRIGPSNEEGGPDLRNLTLMHRTCVQGDILLMVSDGVHDNLDPQLLGFLPKHLGLSGSDWSTVEPVLGEQAKDLYRTAILSKLLVGVTSAAQVADIVIRHCMETTAKSREFMERYPGRTLPDDYKTFQGKLDHTTVLVTTVGEFDV